MAADFPEECQSVWASSEGCHQGFLNILPHIVAENMPAAGFEEPRNQARRNYRGHGLPRHKAIVHGAEIPVLMKHGAPANSQRPSSGWSARQHRGPQGQRREWRGPLVNLFWIRSFSIYRAVARAACKSILARAASRSSRPFEMVSPNFLRRRR
jgi:hypothetical protein